MLVGLYIGFAGGLIIGALFMFALFALLMCFVFETRVTKNEWTMGNEITLEDKDAVADMPRLRLVRRVR